MYNNINSNNINIQICNIIFSIYFISQKIKNFHNISVSFNSKKYSRFILIIIKMPIDINLLRPERGGDPEKVKESQRRRYADVTIVDKVMDLDKV